MENSTTAYGYVCTSYSGEFDTMIVEYDPSDMNVVWVYWKINWDLDLATALFRMMINVDQNTIGITHAFMINDELGGKIIKTSRIHYMKNRTGIFQTTSSFQQGLQTIIGNYELIDKSLEKSTTSCLKIDEFLLTIWQLRCNDISDDLLDEIEEIPIPIILPPLFLRKAMRISRPRPRKI